MPKVIGGPPSVQDTIKTMNQAMGQLMTFISNQNQIAAIEKLQDQDVFVATWLKNPAMMVMNAEDDNPALRAGMDKYFGVSGDAYELWRKGIREL